MSDPIAYYRQLLDKIDAHASRIATTHADSLRCRRGCTACCHQDLSVSSIEADSISRWLAEQEQIMPRAENPRGEADDHPLFPILAGSTSCVFLGPDGGCQIYPVRPVICRTHGLPLATPSGERDVCPLNFTGSDPGLAGLETNDLLELTRLNTMLAAIDHAYIGGASGRTERTSLAALREQAERRIRRTADRESSDEECGPNRHE